MTEPTTRSRKLWYAENISGSRSRRTSYGGPVSTTVTPWDPIIGTQITVSEGHPFHKHKRGKLKGDLGGEFETSRNYAILGLEGSNTFFATSNYPSNYTWSSYRGPLVSYPAQAAWPPPFPPSSPSSRSTLEQRGATAIARCAPTNSVADVSTFLGELLKDGLPTLPGQQTMSSVQGLRSLGGEYLNVVFGWQPIVADVKKFSHAVRHAQEVLDQYERDAGRVVRRRYYFPVSVERETSDYGLSNARYWPATSDLNAAAPYGRWVREREITRYQWFSGAFTYYLPSGYDSRKAMKRYALMADKLFGLALTPEVLWNLAPWSWAVDWFSNTGDVLANISSMVQDGLVLRYGYLMEKTIVKDTYTMTQEYPSWNRGLNLPMSSLALVTETKKRIRANPYGFGVKWEDLSPSQLAILAALGISKHR